MSEQSKPKQFAFPSEVADQIKGFARVYVVTPSGKKSWVSPKEIPEGSKVLLKDGKTPITMDNAPGRPKKTEEEKEELFSELVAEKKKRRKNHLKSDVLLRKARREPDSSDFMDLIMVELAQEAAGLAFEIEELQNEGKEVSQASGRRVRVLEKLGDAWLRRQERLKNVGVVDLDSPAISAFMKAYTEELVDVMRELEYRDEGIESLMNRFSSRIDDEWKVGVRKRMKKAAEG